MSLGGLNDTAIYQWINRVGVCEDYAFLLSYGKYRDFRWMLQRKGVCDKISYEWDNIDATNMVMSVIKSSSIFH